MSDSICRSGEIGGMTGSELTTAVAVGIG